MKFVKKKQFEGAWSELEPKKCFQRQLWTKYLRKALVFV